MFSRTGAPVYAKRPLSVKGALPLTRNTTFHTLPPAGVPLEPPLAEPSWAARPKREPGGQKKIASRAGQTLINFTPLGNGGPGGLQKRCSRVRETPTFSKRCAPVYVKHPLGKQGWSTRPPQDTQPAGLVHEIWQAGRAWGLRLPRRTDAPVYVKRPLSVKGALPLTRNTTFHTLPPAGVTLEPPLPSPDGQPNPNAKLADRNF